MSWKTALYPIMSGFKKTGNWKRGRHYDELRYAYQQKRRNGKGKGPANGGSAMVDPGYTSTRGYYGRFASGSQVEQKFHDIVSDDNAISATGDIQPVLLTIAQGTTEVTRIGRRVIIRKIQWRFQLQLDSGTDQAATSDVVRVILFQDKQANGAAATVTNILETADYQSFRNLAESQRFTVLMDRTYDLVVPSAGGNGTAIETGEFVVSDSFYKDCSIPIEYSGTTGAITEIRSNNIGLLLITKAAIGDFFSQFRFRFTD